MKRTAYNWQYGDCLYRIEEWRDAPLGTCPYTVYMLSSNNGRLNGLLCGIFHDKI